MTLEELELLRSRATQLHWISIALGLLGMIVMLNSKTPGTVMIIIACFLEITFVRKQKTKYTKAFKTTVVKDALNKKFKEVTYFPEMGIPHSEIIVAGLFKSGDKYSSNDYLKAKYHGVKFQQADISIEKGQGDDKVNLFRGRILIVDIDQIIPHAIQIYGDNFRNPRRKGESKIGFLDSFTTKATNDYLEQIEMESVDFNKKFNVFSTSAHTAFYILTPQVMEVMDELYRKYHGKIALCFLGKRIYVGIQTEIDAFEVECRSAEGFDYEYQKVNNEIKVITNFIDTIRNEEKLFEQMQEEYDY